MASESKRIDIALSSDLRFYPGLLVTACSIAQHADRNYELFFHVLDGGIGEDNRCDLQDRIARLHPNVVLDWQVVDTELLAKLPEWRGCGKMTWARLLLPNLFPSVNWMLYVDVDFFCMGDVVQLWRMRDPQYALMSALDCWPLTMPSESFWFKKNGRIYKADKYFCAGFCFFNLEKIRREGLDALFADIIRKNESFPCVDQSVLNLAFVDRCDLRILPRKWQTFTRDIQESEFAEKPFIHFAGEAPWVCFRINKIFDDASLFWFRWYSKLCGLTLWQALRRFYSAREIILYRGLYLIFSRSKMMLSLLHGYFRMIHHEESIVIYDALLHRVRYPRVD